MPDNIDKTVESFVSSIQKIEDELKDDLERLSYRMRDMTETQLLQTTRRLNFLQELIDKGYGDEVNGLMANYDNLLKEAVDEAKRRGIPPLKSETVQALQQLKDLDTEILLGRASAFSNDLKKLLFTNIYSGTSISEIVSQLGQTKLATHQLNVVVNTGLRQFSDFSRYNIFKGENVRWTYVGTQDARTRPACVSTNNNEPANGYTEAQVNDSDTPFGVRGGFNCRHSWMVL